MEDLEAALETLEAIGVRPNAAPRRSDDSVSIWTDPDTTDGVSYQFMQKDGSDRAQ